MEETILGNGQGDERKQTVRRGVENDKVRVKPGAQFRSGTSPKETCIPIGYPPAYRRRELDRGFRAERGNLCSDAKGEAEGG